MALKWIPRLHVVNIVGRIKATETPPPPSSNGYTQPIKIASTPKNNEGKTTTTMSAINLIYSLIRQIVELKLKEGRNGRSRAGDFGKTPKKLIDKLTVASLFPPQRRRCFYFVSCVLPPSPFLHFKHAN